MQNKTQTDRLNATFAGHTGANGISFSWSIASETAGHVVNQGADVAGHGGDVHHAELRALIGLTQALIDLGYTGPIHIAGGNALAMEAARDDWKRVWNLDPLSH